MSEYVLLAFGGAGPTHVAGYTQGIPLWGILIFPYSSVFSAFGAAAADFEHHYLRALNLIVPPAPSNDLKLGIGQRLSQVWEEMEQQAIQLFAAGLDQ
ncbi:MAG: hypothetical protein HYY20_02300 [Candidatus Tectomicrobia bacterium]|uniref:Hydantoinase A/oxoprolinase domain-containing protein n=1 Tax=Tectimicrobiota bacterium TaxID=2528274 RepID=A0A932CM65_UNCTE|nr:hypothetical protein [Candidatus Tectomicrobia bacterium]